MSYRQPQARVDQLLRQHKALLEAYQRCPHEYRRLLLWDSVEACLREIWIESHPLPGWTPRKAQDA